MAKLRKYLSASGLLSIVQKSFSKIREESPAEVRNRSKEISLLDCLLSGLAVFGVKSPSLLQFDQQRRDSNIANNLKSLYGIKEIPSDTQMRRRLDPVDFMLIRKAFKQIFSVVQRGKALEEYIFYDKHYLLSIDGTGQYSSEEIHCDSCCVKNHKGGRVSYYHQMLGAVIVHPKKKIVIPFAPEPITKRDGANKNDCERNASKRLLSHIRREHPHLKLIIIEDALSSNAPHIQHLKSLNMRFILGVKPKDHQYLFDWVKYAKCIEHEEVDLDGVKHKFRFINGAPINESNEELKINFLEYWEEKPNGKKQHFSWVSDIHLNKFNVHKIMRGGRARWKIENETFNTLKNQGYNFEHNYGHGNKNLCSVFTMLMMLAFLIDQVQELCCHLFQSARAAAGRKVDLWYDLRALFKYHTWASWESLFTVITAHGWKDP